MEETAYDARLDPDEPRAVLDCGCLLEWNDSDGSAEFKFCISHRLERQVSGLNSLIEISKGILLRLDLEYAERIERGESPIFPNAATREVLRAAIAEADQEIDTLRSMLKAA